MEIVDIVEKNIHLAEANSALLSDLVAYIKHVAVLRALRESDDYSFNPISLDAPFPSDFKEKIDKRSEALQKEYNKFALLNKGAKRAVKKSPKPNHTS
jgi:hypothetical protein